MGAGAGAYTAYRCLIALSGKDTASRGKIHHNIIQTFLLEVVIKM